MYPTGILIDVSVGMDLQLVNSRTGRLVGSFRAAGKFASVSKTSGISGTPIEIVSKVIPGHVNLSTTRRYLGKASDADALRWIDKLQQACCLRATMRNRYKFISPWAYGGSCKSKCRQVVVDM